MRATDEQRQSPKPAAAILDGAVAMTFRSKKAPFGACAGREIFSPDGSAMEAVEEV